MNTELRDTLAEAAASAVATAYEHGYDDAADVAYQVGHQDGLDQGRREMADTIAAVKASFLSDVDPGDENDSEGFVVFFESDEEPTAAHTCDCPGCEWETMVENTVAQLNDWAPMVDAAFDTVDEKFLFVADVLDGFEERFAEHEDVLVQAADVMHEFATTVKVVVEKMAERLAVLKGLQEADAVVIESLLDRVAALESPLAVSA